ncbi:MAG: IS1182 family transposase [Myxococcota bacterium]
MSLGRTPAEEDLFRSTRAACEARLPEASIFRLLARESHRLFADEAFADLFTDVGRRSIPPRIVAVVMVLQRLHGMSDREAVDAFAFDLRWKYAAGALDFDYPGFVHTVLVDMRERLRRSERPNRIFEVVLEVANEAGLVGRKRVLDSTALYDAVATQDTVTMIRSAIVALLRLAGEALEAELGSALSRDDDYQKSGKPKCDWEDAQAREALVDALAKDGRALLARLDDRQLPAEVKQAAELLATLLGQDLETTEDGRFRIARRVAENRIISTVDPEARHGHKTASRGFDGYKGHVAIDPDSEIITATEVTAGNVGDAQPAAALAEDVLTKPGEGEPRAEVYGDSSYGTADLVERIEGAGGEANVKVQPPSPPKKGMLAQDAFDIDTKNETVRCPAGMLVQIRRRDDGSGSAEFGTACDGCALRERCTTSKQGRSVNVHPKFETLHRSRERQRDPAWKARYRATRPKVERKIAHLMRRKHGGRRARVRGRLRVAHDFALLAAAVNLARIAKLRVVAAPA